MSHFSSALLSPAWLRAFAGIWFVGAILSPVPPRLYAREPGGERINYRVLAPREGEICVVCDRAVAGTDRVYEVEGHRVPVHAGACDAAFRRSPEVYLVRLRPRGAFLGAESSYGPGYSLAWFALGTYVLVGLVFGAICAGRAVNRSLKPLPWFFAGFLLNLFGFLVLLTRAAGDGSAAPEGLPAGLVKVPTTYAPRTCPHCGSTNHPSAAFCTGCGAELHPFVSSEVVRVGLRSGSPDQPPTDERRNG